MKNTGVFRSLWASALLLVLASALVMAAQPQQGLGRGGGGGGNRGGGGSGGSGGSGGQGGRGGSSGGSGGSGNAGSGNGGSGYGGYGSSSGSGRTSTSGRGYSSYGYSRHVSRSGQPSYQGSHAQIVSRGYRINSLPTVRGNGPTMQQIASQKDFINRYGNNARRGYYPYNHYWTDSSFFYPYYVFDPYSTFGYISPWYFYPGLPGYIEPSRCFFLGANQLPVAFVGGEYSWSENTFDQGSSYDAYSSGYRDGYNASQKTQQDNALLDSALDEIVNVFKNDDMKALDHLVPESGDVNIYVNGAYSYSLSADDFYDLIQDNASTTKTVKYEILDVRTDNGEAKVEALHTFTDPWGNQQQVYHTYLLKVSRRSARIVEYGTSDSRPW